MLKRKLWPLLYGIVLAAFTAYVLLDAFVIPRSYSSVQKIAASASSAQSETDSTSSGSAGDSSEAESAASAEAAVTDSTYEDGDTSVTITQYRESDTTVYVADITLSSASALKTALAQNTYGKNITQTTSAIAAANNAILAINGDYYGTRNGYVIRNGVLYRSSSAGSDQQDLVVYQDGSFAVVSEGDATAQELLDDGAWQVLSFGPALVENGAVAVSTNEEVDRAKTSNPRTAIGVIDDLHYVFVVADGRTSQSAGLSLYELAEFMQSLGVKTAYNLDGGGSSTMVFNGSVVNQPTTNGNTIKERAVSDIVYIG